MKYTHVNYKKIYDELEKFAKFNSEVTNQEPDKCSQIWQVAQHIIEKAESIKRSAVRKEREFNK